MTRIWWAEDDLPGLREWRPLDEGTRELFLTRPGDRAWVRALPDGSRGGLPNVVMEVAWLDGDVLHRIAMSGITLDRANADGVDEREILDHTEIPASSIARTTLGLGTGNARVELTDGTAIEGLPMVLINQMV